MTKLRCCFCQQELEEETFSRGRVFVSCNNPNCIISDWGGCSKQIITELIRTRKALDKGMKHITGLNNMIKSWLNLIDSDLDQETKLHILKSAISTYVKNKGSNNE